MNDRVVRLHCSNGLCEFDSHALTKFINMTMKEACNYVKTAQLTRGREHRRVHSHEVCGKLTDSEWLSIVTRQKKTFAKGKTFAHTARWKDHHEKWDLKTIKL